MEDSIGLKAETEIRDSSIIEKAKQGNFLQGWSFGFIERKIRFEKGSDGIERRFIEDLDLKEVSLLSVKPAYPCCSVEIRNNGIYERRYSDLNLEIKNHEIKNPNLDLYENEIKYLTLKGMF